MDDSWKEKCKHLPLDVVETAERFLKLLPETATEIDPKSEHGEAGIAYAFELVGKAIKRHEGPVDENTRERLMAYVLEEANQGATGYEGEGTPFGEMQRIRFEETGNPLFAWLAVHSEVGKSNLPDWLKGCLQKYAGNVVDLAVRACDDTTMVKTKLDNQVKKAFQIKGRGQLTDFVECARKSDCRDEMRRVRYEETGNPLFAWLAVHGEVGKSNLPDWLKGYLHQCGADLLGLADQAWTDKSMAKKKLDNRVKKAFQIEGRDHLAGFVEWMRNWDVYWDLREERERENAGKTQGYYATEEVGKKHHIGGRHVTELSGRERKFQDRFKEELFDDE